MAVTPDRVTVSDALKAYGHRGEFVRAMAAIGTGLAAGTVPAFARINGEGEPRPVPPGWWRRLIRADWLAGTATIAGAPDEGGLIEMAGLELAEAALQRDLPPLTDPAEPPALSESHVSPRLAAHLARVLGATQRRPGPRPGTVDRYVAADRALYPEMSALMIDQKISAHEAARELVRLGKVAGRGRGGKNTGEYTRTRRLATRFLRDWRATIGSLLR